MKNVTWLHKSRGAQTPQATDTSAQRESARIAHVLQISSNAGKATSLADLAVLVLEDDPITLFTIKECLMDIGIRNIRCVSSLRQLDDTDEAIRSGNFDLMIFDVALPDGTSFAKADLYAKQTNTPIIAFTGREDAADAELVQYQAFKAILHKPLTYHDLQDKICDVIVNRVAP